MALTTLPENDLIHWATNDLDPDSNPTKLEPPDEVQDDGLLRREPMGRQWLNYIINNQSEYIAWCVENIQDLDARVTALEP